MKICLKCNRGLFDSDIKCDKCGCTDIMDKYEYKELYERFKTASHKEQERLRQSEEYKIICKYKFIVDIKNTPEMRKEQSIRDKQAAKQKAKEDYDMLQRRVQQKSSEEKRLEKQTSINIPTCPYCQSTNVSKISTLGRVVSVGLFGLGSSKIGKQWYCKDCGSNF